MYIHRSDWIEWRGNKYYLGDYVLCGFQDDDLPQFSKVHDILVVESEAFLCTTLYFTRGIDRHYHGYVIVPTLEKRIIYVSDKNELLGSLHPLRTHSLRSKPGTLYIVTKCIVIKT